MMHLLLTLNGGLLQEKEASLISSRQSSAIGAFSSVQDSTSSVALGHGSQVSGENNVVSVGAGPEGYGESVKEHRKPAGL